MRMRAARMVVVRGLYTATPHLGMLAATNTNAAGALTVPRC
jgi:hypothetical protein